MTSVAYVVGIDEVGRGSLAGPVMVAACAMPVGMRPGAAGLGALRDSKALSASARKKWRDFFHDHTSVQYAVSQVSPHVIDRMNIACAANIAAGRAFARLCRDLPRKGNLRVYLDGGLYLPDGEYPRAFTAMTLVRGDMRINAIKAASIVAKVHRDAVMERYAEKFPEYGFEVHKGYGTELHRRRIVRQGPCSIHRHSFLSRI